jgi:poly-gamma-glutamate synthesis protein (capsule biosynthesis protein)
MQWRIAVLVVFGGVVLGSLAGAGVALQQREQQRASAARQEIVTKETPSSTPNLEPLPTNEGATVTIIFGGDVMLGRTVESRMKARGATWPFKEIASKMASADYTVVNLESPFRKDFKETPIDSLVLRGDPRGIEGLQLAGVDAVSLANNHIPDMGKIGLEETLQLLSGAKISQTGAGVSKEAAEVPLVAEVHGIKLGFISVSYGVNFESSGVFYNRAQALWVTEKVASLKKEVDVVVLLCHCGNEYATAASAAQKEVARAAIDAGASLVVGHHPHVPQPVERYKDGVIIYSLGNLVFDQLPGNNRDQSALAEVRVSTKGVVSLELLPYKIFDYGQPRFLQDSAGKAAVFKAFGLAEGKL